MIFCVNLVLLYGNNFLFYKVLKKIFRDERYRDFYRSEYDMVYKRSKDFEYYR